MQHGADPRVLHQEVGLAAHLAHRTFIFDPILESSHLHYQNVMWFVDVPLLTTLAG